MTSESVSHLRSPAAIRERCAQVFKLAEAGKLPHFSLRLDALPAVADRVIAVTRRDYPTLAVPYHSRWRHFDAGGVNRTAALDGLLAGKTPAERGRARFELAIVSVLLDAGAGMQWRYRDARGGVELSKSEGLAVATLDMFCSGLFSSVHKDPCRVDPAGLRAVDKTALARAFQVDAANPLTGLDGRLGLLHALATAVATQPAVFGAGDARLGRLFDHLAGQATGGRLPAAKILAGVLTTLGGIWPGRVTLDGVNLGDVWHHDAVGLVPFHKLSQWLTYSLVEPLEDAGIVVTDLDELTGLPEYRNGGLFLDLGVLVPKHADVLGLPHAPDSQVVVEWRALTVVLLDRVADVVRARLGKSAQEMPLAKVLQGGTWTAGRETARERRADGGPPVQVVSDGTVF